MPFTSVWKSCIFALALGALTATGAQAFGTGTFLVGIDVSPGLYRSTSDGNGPCFWFRLSGLGGTADDVIALEVQSGSVIAEIAPTDYAFRSTGCTEWKRVDQSRSLITYASAALGARDDDDGPELTREVDIENFNGPLDREGSFGFYSVPDDMEPGTYRSEAPDGATCVAARYSAGMKLEEVITAKDRKGRTLTITVQPSDTIFLTAQCQPWIKIR